MSRSVLILMVVLWAASVWGAQERVLPKEGDQVVVELVGGNIIVGRYMGLDGLSVVIDVNPKGGGLGTVKVPEARVASIRPIASSELAARGPASAPASQPAAEEETSVAAMEEGPELTDFQQELLLLLLDFPPEAGWTDERYEEMGRRNLLMDLRPTLQEARFAKVYPDWLEARALRVRLDREEPPDRPHHHLAPAEAWQKFADTKVWTDQVYNAMKVRMFVEGGEQWRQGKELASGDRKEETLTAAEAGALRLYRIFPEKAGWTEGRLDSLKEAYEGGEPLTDDERLFVLAYPDYLEGRSMYARAKAAAREPNLSYDEINERLPDTDVSGKNISEGTVSDKNVAPLGGAK